MAWKKQHKLGQFKEVDPEELKAAEEERLAKEAADRERIKNMKIGDRYSTQGLLALVLITYITIANVLQIFNFFFHSGVKFACPSSQPRGEKLHI